MPELSDSGRAVQEGLGHTFSDPDLLNDALTHSSFANEKPQLARTDNELLEFLGDAVLQWVVSALLVERFGDGSAGEMTRRRADLVCEEGLAEIARQIRIGEGLRLGKGEDRTGGREKPRLLASALEACVAAVYLDSDPYQVMKVCRGLFEGLLDDVTPGARDFKTRVQEALQRHGKRPPRYDLVASSGPDHERNFQVALSVEGEVLGEGSGSSKLEAEMAAAKQALQQLGETV